MAILEIGQRSLQSASLHYSVLFSHYVNIGFMMFHMCSSRTSRSVFIALFCALLCHFCLGEKEKKMRFFSMLPTLYSPFSGTTSSVGAELCIAPFLLDFWTLLMNLHFPSLLSSRFLYPLPPCVLLTFPNHFTCLYFLITSLNS